MPGPYSTDLRERVLVAVEAGESAETVAEWFLVGRSSVYDIADGAERHSGAGCASLSFAGIDKDVAGRDKPGHDAGVTVSLRAGRHYWNGR